MIFSVKIIVYGENGNRNFSASTAQCVYYYYTLGHSALVATLLEDLVGNFILTCLFQEIMAPSEEDSEIEELPANQRLSEFRPSTQVPI